MTTASTQRVDNIMSPNMKIAVPLAMVTTLAALSLIFVPIDLGGPDVFQPDPLFELQFGRGSGWHGLDLLRITSDRMSFNRTSKAGGGSDFRLTPRRGMH